VRNCLLAAALLLGAFLALGLAVRGAPSLPDLLAWRALGEHWQGPSGSVAFAVSLVLGPVLPLAFGTGLALATIVLHARGDRQRAVVTVRVLLLLVACRLTSVLAKPVFDRDRPRAYGDFSYPSGHVVSVASTGFAAVVLCLWLFPPAATLVRRIAVAATVLAAAARVVLGVHWLTDTIGAILAVCGVGLLVGVALRVLPADRPGVLSSS
jgi:undecaprenyl-diphosphatase